MPAAAAHISSGNSIATISDLTRIMGANQALGVMQSQVRATTDYLKSRKQFGVPLKTFQALTFRAADMYVSLELARSIALWASLVLDAGGDVVAAADRTRLQTSKAGRHIGQESVQLHGGIGVTAEYSIGHRLSRLTAIDHLLGDGDWALARVAARVGDGRVDATCDGVGWLLGDRGSGFWIGHRVVRAAAAALDESGAPTTLVELVLTEVGIDAGT